jgi:aminomethyltransferase
MSDMSMRALLPTPLHARTADLCATNQWVAAGSFTIPLVYSSEAEEHGALSARAGLSDISALQRWRFEGPDAAAFLAFATTCDAQALPTGQTARLVWCDDFGQVRGEGVLARLGDHRFEIATVVRDFAWLADGALGFDAAVTDMTGRRAGLQLAGPHAFAILQAAGFVGASPPGATAGGETSVAAGWRQSQVTLVRDDDAQRFELWVDAEDAVHVWDRVMRVGAGFGIAPVGARVLEVARIEAGRPLPGLDWVPAWACLHEADLRVPSDLGLATDPMRRFNGSQALGLRPRSCGYRLVLLASARRLSPGEVIAKGGSAGRITSAAFSTATERHVALGWIRDDLARPGQDLGLPGTAGSLDIQVVRPCHS